jgi:hypothetical protein
VSDSGGIIERASGDGEESTSGARAAFAISGFDSTFGIAFGATAASGCVFANAEGSDFFGGGGGPSFFAGTGGAAGIRSVRGGPSFGAGFGGSFTAAASDADALFDGGELCESGGGSNDCVERRSSPLGDDDGRAIAAPDDAFTAGMPGTVARFGGCCAEVPCSGVRCVFSMRTAAISVDPSVDIE